ncbi:putative ribonuclease H-like domain-containing protein [Tanacetum coccineum]|uniref:Ribonuclease H-like domain-containing protein n=1 Tax=Tanacetum coccineum TaxID=301880 RepID=A0ABQ5CFE7_9ASTR
MENNKTPTQQTSSNSPTINCPYLSSIKGEYRYMGTNEDRTQSVLITIDYPIWRNPKCGNGHLLKDSQYQHRWIHKEERYERFQSLPQSAKKIHGSKVWSDAPIIEEYESDSDDECVTVQTKELDTPSFANKQIKTPRENVKNQSTHSQKPKVNNKELGNGVTERACFGEKTTWNNGPKHNPHRNLQNKGIIDSGCSRHMTGNKAYLADFQDFNGGPVAFGGSKGYITGKGKIKTGKLDFEDIENQLNQKVKTIRSDNGTEFKNKDVIEFCGLKGIKREYSNARTPQQNGVAERKNRTLIEAARTMLADSFLPNTFWAEAVSTACYVLNRVLVTKPHNKTPYELLTGKGPTWLFDLDYLTDSMNYHPVSSENQANLHAGQQEANQNAGTEEIIDAGDSNKEDESAQDYFVLPIWPSYSSTITPALTTDDKREGPREEEQVFMDDLERLKRQEKEANEEAEALRKKFEHLVIKEGAAKPSSTNIFSTVSTPAKASSTNLVNTVSIPSLADPTHPEEDDSEIPPLEDIYQNSTDGIFTTSSYDDEGAVADFTNLESVVNVSPIPTSRIHSSHPKALILGDPTSAVQTRSKVNTSSGAHAFVSYVQKQKRTNHKDFHHCLFACFLSQHEPKKISEALEDESWVDAMQEELLQFEIQKVWVLVDLPYGKKAIGTKWVYRNKKDERGVVGS